MVKQLIAMEKFNVLERNAKFITSLGIHSYCFTEPINEFLRSFSSYCIIWVLITSVITSVVFIYMDWPQMETVSRPIIVSLGCCQVGVMFSTFGLNMIKVKQVHLQLQKIIDNEGKAMACIYYYI